MPKRKLAMVLACGLLGAGVCAAEPQVVHDSGAGVPLGPLLSQAMTPADIDEVSALVQFPVRSRIFKPGTLPADKQVQWPDARWLVMPVFLIGDDAQSLAWLQDNRGQLAGLSATGMVVQVATPAAYKRIERLAHGVPMAPATSPWLEERLAKLGAAVLPLLILPDGRITQAVPPSALVELQRSLRSAAEPVNQAARAAGWVSEVRP